MPMATVVPAGSRPARRRRRPEILLLAAVFAIAFTSGLVTSRLLHRGRVQAEAERLSQTFIEQAIRLEIIKVDQDRLSELERLVATSCVDGNAGPTVPDP